jgi:hypothetical protein
VYDSTLSSDSLDADAEARREALISAGDDPRWSRGTANREGIAPVRCPGAAEVVVRPAPAQPARRLHDLHTGR